MAKFLYETLKQIKNKDVHWVNNKPKLHAYCVEQEARTAVILLYNRLLSDFVLTDKGSQRRAVPPTLKVLHNISLFVRIEYI